MTGGTKIFLAIVALIAVILVVYYGWLLPNDDDALAINGPTPTDRAPQPAETAPAPAQERTATPRDRAETLSERGTGSRLIPSPPRPEPDELLDEDDPADDEEAVESDVAPDLEDDEPAPRDEVASDEEENETDPTADRDREPIEDHLPVDPTREPVDDGGKDAPEPQPAPTSEDDDEAEPDDEDAPAEEEDADEPAEPERPRVTPPDYTMYTVRPNDTLSSIAQEWFGDAGKWDLIAKANPFVDPNRLAVGDELRLPPRDAEREEIKGRAGDRPTVYRVRSGDNLSKIARAYYGNSGLWRIIYEANRPTIGPNPSNLKVGMELTIPPAPQPAEDDD